MPGANCSIFGCKTSRAIKGISLFKLPAGKDEYNQNWCNKLIAVIIKDRVVDKILK